MRQKGNGDPTKKNKILKILKKNGKMHMRQIARELKMPTTTCFEYLTKHLVDEVEVERLGKENSIITLYRVKE